MAGLVASAGKTRPKTLAEKQPYLLGYAAGISVISPAATAWQLCKVYGVKGIKQGC